MTASFSSIPPPSLISPPPHPHFTPMNHLSSEKMPDPFKDWEDDSAAAKQRRGRRRRFDDSTGQIPLPQPGATSVDVREPQNGKLFFQDMTPTGKNNGNRRSSFNGR